MTTKIIISLLAVGIIFRVVSALVIPPFMGNDELAHLRYVGHIEKERRLPNLNLYPNEESAGNEYFQPPLYYSLVSFVLLLTENQISQLYLLRFVSILFFLPTFFLAFKTLRLLKVDSSILISTLAVVSLLPGYVFNSASVTNDSQVILLSSATIYYLMVIIKKPLNWGRVITLAVLCALTVLSKLNGAVIIPAVIIFIYKKSDRSLLLFSQKLLLFLGITFLPISAWFLYNQSTYQYWLGPIKDSTATFVSVPFDLFKIFLVSRGTFATFWAAWGPTNAVRLPLPVYLLLFLLSVVAIAGLIKSFPRFAKKINLIDPLTLFVTIILTNILLLYIFNISQLQPLGRYLFPSIIPISLFFILGLNNCLPPKPKTLAPIFIISMLIFLNLLGINTLLHYF